MKFGVRKLRTSDIEIFEKELRSMWLQHSQKHPNLISSELLKETDIKEYLESSLRKKTEFVLVALSGIEPVGIMKVEEQKLEDFFHYKRCFFLDDVVVLPDFRRKGVATFLMEEVKRIAEKKGIHVLKSRVYKFNKPAIKHLEAQSFENLYSEYFCVV
jgi:GNAT superfamily N-acetyltransferase